MNYFIGTGHHQELLYKNQINSEQSFLVEHAEHRQLIDYKTEDKVIESKIKDC